MNIKTSTEAEQANERFNYFHDGLIRRLEFNLESEVMELKTRDGSTFEDEVITGTSVAIDIAHTNYDYPNQPDNRLVLIKASGCIEIFDSFVKFIQADVFDLRFRSQDKGIACLLTYHTDDVGMIRSLENGTQIVLFVAKSVEIEESTYEVKK